MEQKEAADGDSSKYIKPSQVAFLSKMIYKISDKDEIFHSLQLSLWVYGGIKFHLCLEKNDFTFSANAKLTELFIING